MAGGFETRGTDGRKGEGRAHRARLLGMFGKITRHTPARFRICVRMGVLSLTGIPVTSVIHKSHEPTRSVGGAV